MMCFKIYKSVVANANKSLKNSIKLSRIASTVTDQDIVAQMKKHLNQEPIYAWDFGIKATSYVTEGAKIGILCKNDLYVGECMSKIHDPGGEIGDAIGWHRQFKKPWENVVLIKDINYTKLNQVDTETLLSSIQTSQKLAPGFYFVHEKVLDHKNDAPRIGHRPSDRVVLRKKGLPSEQFKPQVEPQISPTQQRQDFLYYGYIKELDERIFHLRKSNTHSERDHESLVESFFKNLGYDGPGEIKYRQGRIDVLVQIDSKPVFIIEVKKSWELSRFETNVLKQVFNYAFEIGGRYPVITNGDYYAFFDQQRGLTYEEKFVFEFFISKLTTKDLEKINAIRKDVFSGEI